MFAVYLITDEDVFKKHEVECVVVDHRMDNMPGCSYDSIKDLNSRISHSHSKKVIKHALRQQAKRRRKNTTIASGNSAPLPRIVVKSLPPHPEGKVLILQFFRLL